MKNKLMKFLALVAMTVATLATVPQALAVAPYDTLVTDSVTSIGGLSAPMTTLFGVIIGLALLAGVGYWLVSLSKRKHG